MSAEASTPEDLGEWDFSQLQKRITKMALLFGLPEGCRNCVFAVLSANNLSEAAAQNGLSVRESLESYTQILNAGKCEGQAEPPGGTRDGCMPMQCGHELGGPVLATYWKSSE